MRVCVYPGSFDPVTNGHLDIITRGSALFDKLIVAVLHNPDKAGCFPAERRMDMLARVCAHLPNVTVDRFDGLLADYVRTVGADAVLRGLRSETDFASEYPMAQLNRTLNPKLETVFLSALPEHCCISSGAVRQIAAFGGDITPFVPACIAQEAAEWIAQPMKR